MFVGDAEKVVVSGGVDGGGQPVAFVVDLDDGFVDDNLRRLLPVGGLEAGFLDPVVDPRAAAVDAECIENRYRV